MTAFTQLAVGLMFSKSVVENSVPIPWKVQSLPDTPFVPPAFCQQKSVALQRTSRLGGESLTPEGSLTPRPLVSRPAGHSLCAGPRVACARAPRIANRRSSEGLGSLQSQELLICTLLTHQTLSFCSCFLAAAATRLYAVVRLPIVSEGDQ